MQVEEVNFNHATRMDTGTDALLRKINADMMIAETAGDKPFFDQLLAPTFAFRRARGTYDDRQQFLDHLTPGAKRQVEPGSFQLTMLGNARAFVSCLVAMDTDQGLQRFHNARLFVLDPVKSWRLLAWANEPADP